ncbi:MAG TPA: deoxyribonuclease IV [Ignavibacteriaceae bacterium]|nr:deoxyribonuclease IV [Ignavibacteriaceae bacterium]
MLSISNKLLIGAHTSIRGGVSQAVDLANSLGFTAMQIFTKNNNRWAASPLMESEIEAFKTKLKSSTIKFVQAHDSYLINLCATDEQLQLKSLTAFIDEIDRCQQLDIPYLNFHPGSHCGLGEEVGIKEIANAINIAHEKTPDAKVSSMLELTAGQGSAVGYKFEHIRDIIDLIEDKDRISVCIDTCHIFAAGYDLRSKEAFDKTIKHFDEVIGLDRLKCFHINDSKKGLGSKVDRHEHIGKGMIGLEGFENLMNDKRLKHIPKILETPKEKDMHEDIENINILLSLIKK